MLQVFRSRKMVAITLMGFSSGIPLYLTSRYLQAWLTVEGVSLASIGFISLVSLPYSLKFLWAPVIDRFSLPILGRRKGWLLISQSALVFGVSAMAFHDPRVTLQWLALNAFVIAFLSATQDIVVDAYRTDILTESEAAAGASAGILGYRIALIATGSVALALADTDRFSWAEVYVMLAGLLAIVTVLCTWAPEPARRGDPPQSMRDAVYLPFTDFFSRMGWRKGLWILGFVFLFRLGDFMIGNMTTPFMLKIGFTPTDLAAIQGGVGLLSTIVGALAGGALASRIGLFRVLWIAGGLQAVSNLAYVALAESGANYKMMVGTIVVENVCYGLGAAASVGFLMSLCSPRFSGTQYALLSSLMAVSRDILVSPSGALVDFVGWRTFFLLSVAAALPGLALLPRFAPWSEANKAAC